MVSHPSSARAVEPVNEDSKPRIRARYRRLLRRVLAAERSLKAGAPSRVISPKPDAADQVLDALARAYPPGTRLDTAAIAAAAGLDHRAATAVRRWARGAGRWPYRRPLTGFAALAARGWKGGA